jgi:hypothetical protein
MKVTGVDREIKAEQKRSFPDFLIKGYKVLVLTHGEYKTVLK